MTRRLVVKRRAQLEIDLAVIWYEERRLGLGRELLQELKQVVRTVRERPESFPFDYGTARRARLERFPYAIYHTVTDELISAIAFLHGSKSKEEKLEGRV